MNSNDPNVLWSAPHISLGLHFRESLEAHSHTYIHKRGKVEDNLSILDTGTLLCSCFRHMGIHDKYLAQVERKINQPQHIAA